MTVSVMFVKMTGTPTAAIARSSALTPLLSEIIPITAPALGISREIKTITQSFFTPRLATCHLALARITPHVRIFIKTMNIQKY